MKSYRFSMKVIVGQVTETAVTQTQCIIVNPIISTDWHSFDMETIIKLLHSFGLWTQPYQKHKLWKPLGILMSQTVFLVGPGIVFVFRNHSNFTSAIRAAIESIELFNVVCLAMNLLIHRPALERSYGELQFARQMVACDAQEDVQNALKQLGKITRISFKAYITFQTLISGSYTISFPISTVVHYIKTGYLPPLHGIFEAELVHTDD